VLILVIVFASVLLDILQVMDGEDSALRFYAVTNRDRAVGFFANSNHNAAFLYCAIPFAAAWAIGLVQDHRQNRAIGLALLALLMVAVIIGIAVAQSRAGMALLLVAALSALLLAWRHGRDQSDRRLLYVATGVTLATLLLAFQVGFIGFMQRVEQGGIEDGRWPIAQVTARAAIANMPFGTGMGSFTPVYEKFAPRKLLLDQNRYLNHAHDDWLELWLTGGAPAIALVLGFLAWLTFSTYRWWSSGQQQGPVLDLALARAAPIVIILLLLHSVVDYPLRIPTVLVLFAMACAYLIPRRRIKDEMSARVTISHPGRY